MKGADSMKIKKEDITKELIWKYADVRSIPLGWKRIVYYDVVAKELRSYLAPSEAYWEDPDNIFIDCFVSPAEFWAGCPVSDEEAGITEDMSEDEALDIITNIYEEIWFDEFEFPEELLK
jgi:hypothetical protein